MWIRRPSFWSHSAENLAELKELKMPQHDKDGVVYSCQSCLFNVETF